jgi:hypothetical protein
MRIVAILFAVGAYLELYVALGERSPWGTLFVGLVLAFLSNVAARMAVANAAAVSAIASGSQHSTMRPIGQRITRSRPALGVRPRCRTLGSGRIARQAA